MVINLSGRHGFVLVVGLFGACQNASHVAVQAAGWIIGLPCAGVLRSASEGRHSQGGRMSRCAQVPAEEGQYAMGEQRSACPLPRGARPDESGLVAGGVSSCRLGGAPQQVGWQGV